MPPSNEEKVQRAIGTGKLLKILTTGGPIKIFFTDLKLYEKTLEELNITLRLAHLNDGTMEFKSNNKTIKLSCIAIIGFEEDL
jgi:hypothetical protein